MNRLENWFCASPFWRRITREKLLPWTLEGINLGDRVLEIGAGEHFVEGGGQRIQLLRPPIPIETRLEIRSLYSLHRGNHLLQRAQCSPCDQQCDCSRAAGAAYENSEKEVAKEIRKSFVVGAILCDLEQDRPRHHAINFRKGRHQEKPFSS